MVYNYLALTNDTQEVLSEAFACNVGETVMNTTTIKVCAGGQKVIFRGRYRIRPCFTQLKMLFAGVDNASTPENLFLGSGEGMTRPRNRFLGADQGVIGPQQIK